MNIKHIWALAGKLISKHIILSLLSYLLDWVLHLVVRPLIRYWRLHAVSIACFLDDGLGIEFGYSKLETLSKFVINTLNNAGFVINKEKSVWEPTKTLTWLGIYVNLNKGCLYVSEERIWNLQETAEYIGENLKQ